MNAYQALASMVRHAIKGRVECQIYGFRFLPWMVQTPNIIPDWAAGGVEANCTDFSAGWLFVQCRWLHVTEGNRMRKDRLKLAVSLHFQMAMDADAAADPFTRDIDAVEFAAELEKSKEYWATFVQLMADVGDPVPEDFHWRDHTDLL